MFMPWHVIRRTLLSLSPWGNVFSSGSLITNRNSAWLQDRYLYNLSEGLVLCMTMIWARSVSPFSAKTWISWSWNLKYFIKALTLLTVHQNVMKSPPRSIGDKGEFTAVTYTDTGMVYIGTNTGYVTLWDPRSTACLLHWSAHPQEIDVLWYHNFSLISGAIFLRRAEPLNPLFSLLFASPYVNSEMKLNVGPKFLGDTYFIL